MPDNTYKWVADGESDAWVYAKTDGYRWWDGLANIQRCTEGANSGSYYWHLYGAGRSGWELSRRRAMVTAIKRLAELAGQP